MRKGAMSCSVLSIAAVARCNSAPPFNHYHERAAFPEDEAFLFYECLLDDPQLMSRGGTNESVAKFCVRPHRSSRLVLLSFVHVWFHM